MRDCLLFNNGESTKNEGALALTNLEHCIFESVDIIGANYHGVRISSASSTVDVSFLNCSILNSKQQGIDSSGNTKDIRFSSCDFIQNQQTDFYAINARDWTFTGCNFLENSDTGNDEASIIQTGIRIGFVNCKWKGCKSGVAVTSNSTDLRFTGCDFYDLDNIGIYIGSTNRVAITGCTFNANKWAILSGNNNTGAIICDNQLEANTTAAIILSAADANFIMTGNYALGEVVTLSTGSGHVIANNQGF
jgi:nitrous oxidase accessory protein NosD